MEDLKLLHDKLKEGLILREYQSIYPTMGLRAEQINKIPELSFSEYMNNNYFRARVDSLVAGIMHIVNTYDKEPRVSQYQDALKFAQENYFRTVIGKKP